MSRVKFECKPIYYVRNYNNIMLCFHNINYKYSLYFDIFRFFHIFTVQ